MPKLLTGSMHEAYHFTRQNWRGLFEVSIIPVVIVAVLMAGYFASLVSIFTQIFSQIENGSEPDPALMQAMIGNIFKIQMFAMLVSLVSAFVIALSSVRIVRFFVRGERGLWVMNTDIAKASGMWALYSIGIYFISIFAMFAVMIPFAMVMGILGAIVAAMGPGIVSGIVAGVLGLAGFAFMIFAMFVILLRFASGMPVVALGQTPDFFSEMWKQSKGYGFAMAGRALALYLLVSLVFVLLMAVIAGAGIFLNFDAITQLGEQENPEQILAFLKGLIPWVVVSQIILIVLSIPVYWFGTVWLTVVNKRLHQNRKEKPA